MAEEVTLPQPTNPPTTVVNDNNGGQVESKVTLNPLQIGDLIMAEVDTIQLNGALSDIRREAVEHTDATRGDIKDTRYDIISDAHKTANQLSGQVDAIDDTLSAQLNTLSRDTMDLRSQVTSVGYQVRDGFVSSAKDAEINALKTQMAVAQQSTYLSDKIDGGNQKTWELINSLNDQGLNRQLIERNAELVAERDYGRHWRGNFDQGQWQALNNQLQAFQSQLQETRQGMVNFGTMAGVGQTSTSNNVR